MHLRELNRLAAVGDCKASASRMPSRLVWEKCPWFELQGGTKDGFAYFDDLLGNYVQAKTVAASATTLLDPWAAFTDTSGGGPTVASVVAPTDAVGAMKFNTTTLDEGVYAGLHQAKNLTVPIDALSATNRVWLEGRIKTSTILTTGNAFFFGLMKVGRLVTVGQIAAGGILVAAVDHIGWFKPALTAMTQAQTSTGNGTSTIVDAAAGTLVADTYVNLGFVWDGPGNLATFYFNGVANATTLNISSTQFPAGESLGVSVGTASGATNTSSITLDWVKYAFERVP